MEYKYCSAKFMYAFCMHQLPTRCWARTATTWLVRPSSRGSRLASLRRSWSGGPSRRGLLRWWRPSVMEDFLSQLRSSCHQRSQSGGCYITLVTPHVVVSMGSPSITTPATPMPSRRRARHMVAGDGFVTTDDDSLSKVMYRKAA